MLTSFLNISICFGSYHILFRNKSPEKPVLLPVGLLKKSCLMYQKDRHSSLKRTQGMRRGSSPSLISKNRYLYHQKDKPINEMAAFFRSCPARRPKKPKAERLLYHFDKLTIGRNSDLDVSESYAVLLVHHPSIIFRKRGITPDGFLLVVLLPKGTNGISKCQI